MNKQHKIQNFIGGAFCSAAKNESLPIVNPATGENIGTVANSTAEDTEAAIAAAHAAYPAWSKTPARERARLLREVSYAINKKREELATLEATDGGKTFLSALTVEIPRSAYNFEFFADAITQMPSEAHPNLELHNLNFTLRQPLGAVACISPWNMPLYLLTWKIAPALAAGNCVVAKPSEVTPLTANALAEICSAVGIPAGVLNIVHGQGARTGEVFCRHPNVRAISFTGSTATGRTLAQSCAPHFKKLALEMGGKNPTIVFADCDWEKAVRETLRSTFANQGQICLCGSRILIEKSIYEKFKGALVEGAKNITVGDPFDAKNKMGSLVSKIHFDKVVAAVELAKTEGGKLLCGGGAPSLAAPFREGYFFNPTLIEGLGPNAKTNQDEIFGPVATLQSFSTEAEAAALANATNYGLAATIFTGNVNRAHRMAAALDSGIVWINTWMNRDLRTPFGGIKNSGLGREGGVEALKFFSETKNVCIEYEGNHV